ncbi:uncharacterized protein LOC129591622 [Paramacrobiotus metropolitanus]|uniref:uncharacterized protein LOC129591622 n=1 Tax=Paramacrobiotus metropolitanus TaxID=2943436 RepID=UPI0024458287|nr:uncharacterized protein LOC129591622 [Paramacrobiotus metropolitanus]
MTTAENWIRHGILCLERYYCLNEGICTYQYHNAAEKFMWCNCTNGFEGARCELQTGESSEQRVVGAGYRFFLALIFLFLIILVVILLCVLYRYWKAGKCVPSNSESPQNMSPEAKAPTANSYHSGITGPRAIVDEEKESLLSETVAAAVPAPVQRSTSCPLPSLLQHSPIWTDQPTKSGNLASDCDKDRIEVHNCSNKSCDHNLTLLKLKNTAWKVAGHPEHVSSPPDTVLTIEMDTIVTEQQISTPS